MTNTTAAVVLSADDATAKPLIAVIKSAVNGADKYVKFADAHNVTTATVKDHAYALAVLAYPNAKPVQKVDGKRTVFGNAVQAAGAGLRRAIATEPTPAEKDYLAAVVKAVEAALGHDVTPAQVEAAITNLFS